MLNGKASDIVQRCTYKAERCGERGTHSSHTEQYEDGENLSSPLNSERYFQIVLEGSLSIYYIREDGSAYSLSTGGEGYILGEMSLFADTNDSVFAEAVGRVITLACDTAMYQQELLHNLSFVRFVAAIMANKIRAITTLEAVYSSLPDRVLNFMRYKCEDGVLRGVEKTAFKLHCSPRQLQRILNGFVGEGTILKLRKGTYRLNS